MKKLIILESPNKIQKVLGFINKIDKKNTYTIKASIGHIRELSDDGPYNLGIDLNSMNGNFAISKDKIKVVNDLISEVKKVDEVILATDPDREGEVIAWHLKQILSSYNNNFKRLKLNAITEDEIKNKLFDLEDINLGYVYSGLTRSYLDKIIGYRFSPIIQKLVGAKSIGRVQSATLLLLANREKEILNYKESSFYIIKDENFLTFKNIEKNENNIWITKKYLTKEHAKEIVDTKLDNEYIVKNVEKKEFKDSEYINFTTSDYLQNAKTKLKLSVKAATNIAQSLFEKGLITYIRTDSTKLDEETENKIINFVSSKVGKENVVNYIPHKKEKALDQEGHPPITPTHMEYDLNYVKNNSDFLLNSNELMVYEMIWNNTFYSALKVPGGLKTIVLLLCNDEYFQFEYKNYDFLGYFNFINDLVSPINYNYDFEVGDKINVEKIDVYEEKNKPKVRFNEATLIKELEKRGIGRPSTFKTMVEINVLRNYVFIDKNDKMFVTNLGLKVANFIETEWNEIINIEFTKEMETSLDLIAKTKINYIEFLKKFYKSVEEILNKGVKTKLEKCLKCNDGNMIIRTSKKGNNFKGCSNYPNCQNTIFENDDEKLPLCQKCKIGKLKINKTKTGTDYQYCSNKECGFINWDYGIKFIKCKKCKENKVKSLIAKNGNKYNKCFNESCDFIEFLNK